MAVKKHLSNGRVATFTPLKPSRSGTNACAQSADGERVILLVETDAEEYTSE